MRSINELRRGVRAYCYDYEARGEIKTLSLVFESDCPHGDSELLAAVRDRGVFVLEAILKLGPEIASAVVVGVPSSGST